MELIPINWEFVSKIRVQKKEVAMTSRPAWLPAQQILLKVAIFFNDVSEKNTTEPLPFCRIVCFYGLSDSTFSAIFIFVLPNNLKVR